MAAEFGKSPAIPILLPRIPADIRSKRKEANTTEIKTDRIFCSFIRPREKLAANPARKAHAAVSHAMLSSPTIPFQIMKEAGSRRSSVIPTDIAPVRTDKHMALISVSFFAYKNTPPHNRMLIRIHVEV